MGEILIPLALTLAMECAVALWWGLRRRDLALCALVNLLTNPLVNLVYLCVPSLWVLAGLECAAVAGEWALYRALGERIRRPLCLSLVANAASFFLGSGALWMINISFGGF